MIEQRGAAAVKAHAIDAGIDADLSRIIAAFGGAAEVKDVAIFTPGKLTYINERPPKVHRVGMSGKDAGMSAQDLIDRSMKQWKERAYK